MSLVDAVRAAGIRPGEDAIQSQKKRYSEILSDKLAEEVARGLRNVGFPSVKPLPGQPGEKAFQGGLGPKSVDVSYADERHGLILAVTIKTICFEPYGKNLKNRFYDLCPEAITLHMRFPYSVICALFAFPEAADQDTTKKRTKSTFNRATALLGTLSGRADYTQAGEKFENVTMMLFRPLTVDGQDPIVKLVDTRMGKELSEDQYFLVLRDIYNERNPHATVGLGDLDE